MQQRYLRLFYVLATALICINAHAAIPAGYYSSLKGKSEANLKTALYQIINPHTEVSSYSDLPKYFQKTDVYPNSTRWWDMYSDIPLYAPSFNGLNREHSFPKSWWGGSTTIPIYVDLFHLYPSERAANTAKSNYPLGKVVSGVKFDNGICKVGVGQNSGGAAYVFEPDDEYKGDFARTYFYVVTAYQNLTWKYTYMAQNGTYPTLQPWAINMLLEWHRADKVSQKEIDRNEAVYKIQNNRNPFIDDPELAEYIWGNKKGQVYNPSDQPTPGGNPVLTSPVQDMELDFGQVALGNTATAQLYFKGENLKGYFEFMIYNGDATYFKSSVTKLSATAANSANGAWVTVTYTPTEIGTHTSRFLVSDGGLEGTLGIGLKGECLPRPNLSTPVASEATEVTTDSYTARWDEPSDVVDYYIVTVKRYKGTTVVTETVEAETNEQTISGFSDYDYDVYSVQSSRLGILSEPSNEITVYNPTGIDAVGADIPFTIESYPELLRVRCTGEHSDMRIYDISGRLVTAMPIVRDGFEFVIPKGIYFVTTAQHNAPVKVMAQ